MSEEADNMPEQVSGPPRRRQRRKEARPSEIVEAALELFAERGFGATRMEDVARRAGVAKGTLFVYFPTKQDLFRAVARTITAGNLERLQAIASNLERPIVEVIPALLAHAAIIAETRVPSLIRLLISESRLFPDLARVWHDEVVSNVLGLLTSAIERAQERGELHDGDPQLIAFSIIGPMFSGLIFREVMSGVDAELPDLQKLAAQHAQVILRGLVKEARPEEAQRRS
ncbi:TetR/AcrR family transcriptional regulator [Sphingobium naphthae]|uniref:TetR/AcrR family transcriptional regulator n=1 Tax=Sphingobium naphthae TaxID=1886786 RepID=A0ABU4A0Y6_9SPHN|nr:TetR/AcrR family transcriptional regulator [Sphingobium naphthae]MDV5825428.1 TetR/AcrR family transcriptional regulator [Sphingobium naphthae]